MAKKPIVIGTIGSTHGVRFRARPPRKSASRAMGRLNVANEAMKPPPPGAGAPLFGAEVSGVKPAAGFAATGAEDTGAVGAVELAAPGPAPLVMATAVTISAPPVRAGGVPRPAPPG